MFGIAKSEGEILGVNGCDGGLCELTNAVSFFGINDGLNGFPAMCAHYEFGTRSSFDTSSLVRKKSILNFLCLLT